VTTSPQTGEVAVGAEKLPCVTGEVLV
jgi:hypothetical protein